MIQLLTRDKNVLYELEQSEIFPDYRSVLGEAIALNVDLTGLYVESERLDEIMWRGNDLKWVTFSNCSLKRNEFIDCEFVQLNIYNSDLQLSKFKKSSIKESQFLESNLSKGRFSDCEMENVAFHDTNLAATFFLNCFINEGKFKNGDTNTDWIRDSYFIGCTFSESNMESVKDISVIYFWETNPQEIEFYKDECFTEVINKSSKVLYAIESDVVWWKPYSWNKDKYRFFRGSLEDFCKEVRNGFPTTDLYPDMTDIEIEDELLRVCFYLESWKKNIESV